MAVKLPLGQFLVLAARNVRRNTLRSLLSLVAIAAGVTGIILSGGFVNDLIFQLGESVIHSQSGHIQIGRSGYFGAGSRSPGRYLVSADQASALDLLNIPHVADAMRRVGFTALVGNGRSSYPVVGEGIEAEKEARLGTFLTIKQGRALSSDDRYGAMVGAGVAKAMDLHPGSSFNLVAPTVDEAMNTLDFVVVGIFQSFSKDYDDRTVKVPLAAAQELIDTQGANVIVVSLDETRHTAEVAKQVQARANKLGLEVKTWDWLNDFYWKAVALYDRQFGVLRLIVLFMVVLAVAGAINMSVLERAGEFGTMRALGNRSSDVMRLVIIEGALMGIVGAIVGVAIACGAAWALSRVGIPMPPPPNSNLEYVARIRLSPSLIGTAGAIGVLATVIASLLPALRVSRLPIVEALRRLA